MKKYILLLAFLVVSTLTFASNDNDGGVKVELSNTVSSSVFDVPFSNINIEVKQDVIKIFQNPCSDWTPTTETRTNPVTGYTELKWYRVCVIAGPTAVSYEEVLWIPMAS